MSLLWKQFQFYEIIPIRDPLLGNKDPLYSDPSLTASTIWQSNQSPRSGVLVISIRNNLVKFIDLSNLTLINQFQLLDDSSFSISHIRIINDTFLMIIAECNGKPTKIRFYKINDLIPANKVSNEKNKLGKDTDGSINRTREKEIKYHSEIIVKNGNNTYPITSYDIINDLSCIAIGFLNGRIIIVRGDIIRDRGSKQRIIYEDKATESITSVSLVNDICFATTLSMTMIFNTWGKNKGQPDKILNKTAGCNLYCALWNRFQDKFFTLNSKNELISYKLNSESQIYSLPQLLQTDNIKIKRFFPIDSSHLLFVTEETSNLNSSVLKKNTTNIHRFVILDILNNIIAFNHISNDPVLDILGIVNDSLYILSTNGTLSQVIAKNIHDQINSIIQKEDYEFALTLAEQNKLPDEKYQNIHKLYADFLFKKGQQDEATVHYIQCLGVSEISEIISKFGLEENTTLKPETVQNLSQYLWALVKKNIATADQVTLLLIVLIKLKNLDEFDHFIHHFNRDGIYMNEIIKNDMDNETYFYSNKTLFDLSLILELLKESNFLIEAYEMAKRFAKDPIIIVSILLEDLNEPLLALNFIKSLPVDDTLRILIKFSKYLLENIPNGTNVLLIEVFTGKYKPRQYNTDIKDRQKLKKRDSDITKIFYSYRTFINYMNKTIGIEENEVLADSQLDFQTTYHPPKPSLIFSSFISRPFEFVVFLEACLESYQEFEGSREDIQVILTTLYDLYLSLAHDDISERQSEWKQKAKNILKQSHQLVNDHTENSSRNEKPIDNSLMMLISHMNKIDMEYDEENLKINSLPSDEDNVKRFTTLSLIEDPLVCFKFFEKWSNKNQPELFKVVLSFFISNNEILEKIGGATVLKEKIINPIIENDILSVVELLNILSNTNVVTFGTIRDILLKYIEEGEDENEKNQQLIVSYQEELNSKKEELSKLLDSNNPIQINLKNQKCFICETPLDLPIVYFKCHHIYHQRCLNEEDKDGDENGPSFDCPRCVVDLKTSNKLYDEQKEISKNWELLKNLLNTEEGQKDRFKVVTEFIGRGGLEYTGYGL